MKKKKVVYQDGDYTKVVRGAVDETDENFVVVTNLFGKETKIGKKFVVAIEEMNE